MKKILVLLALLFPSISYAQFACENSAQTTQYGTAGQCGPVSMDDKGNQLVSVIDGTSGLTQSVVPVSTSGNIGGPGVLLHSLAWKAADAAEAGSTVTSINATGHSAAVNNYIYFYSGNAAGQYAWVDTVDTNSFTITPALNTAPGTGNFIIYQVRPITSADVSTATNYNSLGVGISTSFQGSSNANWLLKAEDAAHSSGDAGVQALGVANESGTSFPGAGNDYIPFGLTNKGAQFSVIDNAFIPAGSQATNILKLEDAAHTTGDAGVAVFARNLGSAQAGSSGASGDYVTFDVDVAGRLMINPWGQNTDNLLSSCSAAETGTANEVIVSAVASNRIYITDITCTNPDDTASVIEFKDGSTVVWRGRVSNSTLDGVGLYDHTFATPLRGTVNTAFNFAPVTTATNTSCCASYFTSTL